MSFGLTARRWSDDKELITLGIPNLPQAVSDAEQMFLGDDITEVRVHRVRGARLTGPALFWLAVGPDACPLCGWPEGQGHAPGARCVLGASDGPSAAAAFAALTAIEDGQWDRFLVRLAAAIRKRTATSAHAPKEEAPR